MINQFEFLAEKAGYHEMIPFAGNFELRKALAKRIIETTYTYEISSNEVMETPSDFVSSANTLLAQYGYNVPKYQTTTGEDGNEKTTKYYDQDSRIIVSGDVSFFWPSNLNNIITSIDKGMPVVWWTYEAGDLESHYMNIYEYQIWKATDSDGNVDEHLFFKVCMNYGSIPSDKVVLDDDRYIDSELIKNCSCGFIYFEENPDYEQEIITNYDLLNIDDAYSNSSVLVNSKFFSPSSYTINCKRAAYKEYISTSYTQDLNNKYLSLSSVRSSVNDAYIEFNFEEEVKEVKFFYTLYSTTELLDEPTDKILVQYKNHLNEWIILKDLNDEEIPTSPKNAKQVKFIFPFSITSFRIFIEHPSVSYNSYDLGRLLISNMNFKVGHTHNWNYNISQQNKTHHLRTCLCGDTKLEVHAASAEYIGRPLAPCIVCGYMMSMGSDDKYFDNILGVKEEYVSQNGSILLPNGTIILVYEDYCNYFNGTLKFHLKGQNNI